MKFPGFSRRRARGFAVLACVALTSACGHVSEKTALEPPGWQHQQQANAAVDSWYVQGRLGVQAEHQGGSLDVFWNQQGERYQIRLIAPMGQGAVFISGDAHHVMLKNAEGEIQTSDNPEQLFSRNLDVQLPLNSLQSWLRGLPAPGDSRLQWDELGDLKIVEQSGWRVEMSRYRDEAGYNLPHAFYLSRADRPELMIRLLLRTWQLQDLPAFEPGP